MRVAWIVGNDEHGSEIFFDLFERCQVGWHRTKPVKCFPPYEHVSVITYSFGVGFAAAYVAVFRRRKAKS